MMQCRVEKRNFVLLEMEAAKSMKALLHCIYLRYFYIRIRNSELVEHTINIIESDIGDVLYSESVVVNCIPLVLLL